MLRIKKEIDLKELEKFGFIPYYDCDTGKVKYYYKMIYDRRWYSKKYAEYCIKIDYDDYNYQEIGFKTKKEVKRLIKLQKAEEGNAYNVFFDTLYDLITAGYVEKVEE